MPQFGICCFTNDASAAKSAGWDYIEESVQNLLQGEIDDSTWDGAKRALACPLPILSANLLIPPHLKITGPTAHLDELRKYMTTVLRRANQLNLRTLVFGSGGARNIPEKFDRAKAESQIVDFLNMTTPIAKANSIMIVVEHLSKGETNIITTPAEALTYVKRLNHPNIQMLLDTYHFGIDDISLDSIAPTLPHVKHVHLADRDGRVAPGGSKTADYRPFFRMLKNANYQGNISVEAINFDIAKGAVDVLKFVKSQWQAA